ncbi:hypothetical protein [Leptospira borgpetersenii]|uniref:HEPN domain protein n=2 Tax=Leptospira borgpetersenii TaxID=174 RepID=M3H2Y0_LEPBO|nr:hypothetical protein [Leptospira borgpetersenii]EKP13087.1 hypothetical protein LEP1GSC128_3231 [Leptospira borgpetersenii str. 200801926]EMG01449.1 hypothetical protein LEP1GSC123_4561 [Leptospira borgpetersenii str. 200701203]ENO62530.1 hypothetical protein LEP1GSC191_3828 [Leptospira borgpetersenii serovar Mini str. 201000851]
MAIIHKYNVQSFLEGTPDRILPKLYEKLIGIEIALKNKMSATEGWKSGHRIIDWISTEINVSLSIQLKTDLEKLLCTDQSGNQAMIDSNKYPGIRYLRHESDFTEGSKTLDLEKVMETADTIVAHMKQNGFLS